MNADSTTHPRPIHRSKTLWLGILIITFLAWAWHDSTQWNTTVRIQRYSIRQAGSGISLTDWKVAPVGRQWGRYPIPQSDPIWSRPHIVSPELFRSNGDPKQHNLYYHVNSDATTYEARNSAARHFSDLLRPRTRASGTLGIVPDSRAIFLPHWLIILTFTIPWLTLLIWRSRHHAKHHPH